MDWSFVNNMNTIKAYENDIKLQSEFLKNFIKQEPLSLNHQKNVIGYLSQIVLF